MKGASEPPESLATRLPRQVGLRAPLLLPTQVQGFGINGRGRGVIGR